MEILRTVLFIFNILALIYTIFGVQLFFITNKKIHMIVGFTCLVICYIGVDFIPQIINLWK
jgi:hypothetical protein